MNKGNDSHSYMVSLLLLVYVRHRQRQRL